jgi:hypothetical protein
MKKVYDVLAQCGQCNGEIDHYLTFDEPVEGMKTTRVCDRCYHTDDYAVVTAVEGDRIYRDQEELAEWYEERRNLVGVSDVADLFPGEVPDGVEVVSLTIWTVPESEYPSRDWFTIKEVADMVGKGEEGVRSDYKRGKFFPLQAQGYVQVSGRATILIHRKIVESVYGAAKKQDQGAE